MRPGVARTVGARPLVFAPKQIVFSYELICRQCGWRTVCGRDDAVARLRLIGQLRRERDPEEELVETLFVESAPRMTCPICKEKSLFARPSGRRRPWRLASRRILRDLSRADRVRAVGGNSGHKALRRLRGESGVWTA